MYDEFQNVSKYCTVSPKKKMPVSVPSAKKMPSSFNVAAATSDVPGQKPPMMKPAPMIKPPTMPGQR